MFVGLTVPEDVEAGRGPLPEEVGRARTPERVCALLLPSAAACDKPVLATGHALIGNLWLLLRGKVSDGLAPMAAKRVAADVRGRKIDGLSVPLSQQNLRFARALGDPAAIIEGWRGRRRGALDSRLQDEEAQARHLAG